MKSDEREEEIRWVSTSLLNEEDDEQGSLTMRRKERAKSQGLGQLLAEAFSCECERSALDFKSLILTLTLI